MFLFCVLSLEKGAPPSLPTYLPTGLRFRMSSLSVYCSSSLLSGPCPLLTWFISPYSPWGSSFIDLGIRTSFLTLSSFVRHSDLPEFPVYPVRLTNAKTGPSVIPGDSSPSRPVNPSRGPRRHTSDRPSPNLDFLITTSTPFVGPFSVDLDWVPSSLPLHFS